MFAEHLLSSSEAAEILGVKNQTLRIWRARGQGPIFVRVGVGQRSPAKYRPSDLDRWMRERSYVSSGEELVALAHRKEAAGA